MTKETKIYVVGMLDQDDKPSDIRFLGFDTKAKAEDWAEKYNMYGSAVIITQMTITQKLDIKISGEKK